MLAAIMIAHYVGAAQAPTLGQSIDNGRSPARRVASICLASSTMADFLIESYNVWWKGSHHKFAFHTDRWFGKYHGIDKPGHMFGGYAVFRMTRDYLLYGDHDENTAFWWGVSASVAHSVVLEIGDGLTGYGFDYQDLVFDFVGLGFGMAQVWYPPLQNYNLKFSYWSTSGSLVSPPRVTQDYDALTIWITCNMHNVLPPSIGKCWPEFLQLAVGYGVGDAQTRSEIVVGLDFNLGAFSFGNKELDLIKRQVDLMHFPAPTLKYTQGVGITAHGFHLQ